MGSLLWFQTPGKFIRERKNNGNNINLIIKNIAIETEKYRSFHFTEILDEKGSLAGISY